MGCYPLGKIVSKALGRRNGRDRWREERMDYSNAYPPGPTVTFSGTNSVYVIPPEPPGPQPQQGPEPQRQSQTPPPPQHEPDHHPPHPQPEPPPAAPAQSAPPAEPKQPKRGRKKQPGRVRFGPDPPPPQQQQHAPSPNDDSYAPGHGHGPAPAPQGYFRYTPSPLPRWEATPRRHEYFSGEYRYSYPTPVREGIYSIATDANRLTTIFSEENPNACAIV